MSDPISNMLTSIRNAGLAKLPHTTVPHSKLKESIAKVLQREGYVTEGVVEGKPFKTIKIKLKYTGRKSVIAFAASTPILPIRSQRTKKTASRDASGCLS